MSGYKFDYEKKVWGGERLRINPFHFRASRLYFAVRQLKEKKGKLLDIGCGAGDFPEAFNYYLPNLKITAIDLSKKAIEKAKKRNIKAKFIVASAEKLPFKDNSFDVVTCFDVLEHVKSPEKMLGEIQRVLKPGGTLQSFVPTEDNVFSPEGFLIKLGWKAKEIYGGHPQHYSYGKVKKMFKENGFEIKKIRWGEHFTNQIIEIIYFTFISLRKKNLDSSVEGYIEDLKPSIKKYLFKFIKNFFSAISYFEARILSFIPGGLGIHITAV